MIEVRLSPSRIYAGDPADLEVRLTNTGPGTCTNVVFTIRLPAGITRLGGRETTGASRLAPGRSHTSTLRVQAGNAGRYRLTSPNFSYKDHLGQPHRDTSFAAELVVETERDPLPEPQVSVELRTTELPHDEWSILRGRIVNHGVVSVSSLEIAVSGQVKPDQRSRRISLEQLPAGRSADVSFFVLAGQKGADVPVHLDLTYRGGLQRYHATSTGGIRVVRGPVARPPVAPGQRRSPVKILFLGAEPADAGRLRLGEEIREIQQAIQMGKERDNFKVSVRPAVRVADISQALLDIEPRVVHFAGHGGGPDGSFAAEDEHGHAHLIPVEGLARLFKVAGRRGVECVIVNACSTERLARALSEHIPYTIGMRRPVGDRSAIVFSVGFYQGLAAGLPVEDAFDLGLAQITMRANVDWAAPLLLTGAGRVTATGEPPGQDTARTGRADVIMESGCSEADVLAVTEVFEAAGILADVRGSYSRRSAADLPWVIVIGFSAWAGGTFLKAALQAAGDEAGRDTWRALMSLVRALYQARKASRAPAGTVSLVFPDPLLEVPLPRDLPDEAYHRLCEIREPRAPLSGILMWDSEAQVWADAGDKPGAIS